MIIENFDDFYDHYQRFSAYVAFRMTKDYQLSQDISQDVFLALFKNRDRLNYSNTVKLKALVTKATTNKCIDHFRKASSKREICVINDGVNMYEPMDEEEKNNPEARILRMEEEQYRKLILSKLRHRNPMNYDILVKTKLNEQPAAEVAGEYGITPNNVNNRNLRSKAWLIEEMEKMCRQSKQ